MIELDEDHREWLMRRAFQSAPQEACGFLLSNGKFVEIRNSAANPFNSFAMSSGDLYNQLGPDRVSDIVAIWHTHPHGRAIPSASDMEYMYESGQTWAYIVANKEDVNIWEPGFFSPKDSKFWKEFSK